MEAEKVHQEKVARTIQQKQDGGGALQFVDNRMVNTLLQRVGLEDEEGFQMKTAQLQSDEEEDTLQGKFEPTVQRVEDDAEGVQMKSDTVCQQKPNNTGLPDNLKAGVESLSGFSMDDVKVHYNSSQPATVQALAYTQGTDIHVAWHVAKELAGRVEPTTEVGGMPVNDNIDLEHEADVMGARANSL